MLHRGKLNHPASLWLRHSTLLKRKGGAAAWTGYNVWPIRKLWGISLGRLTVCLLIRDAPRYERLPGEGPAWDGK